MKKLFTVLVILAGATTIYAATKKTEPITYEEFGAVGDGETDDQAAIVAAHKAANSQGRPVKAKDGARYYIGSGSEIAVIMTDVDFGKAEFIIDDKDLEGGKNPVWEVRSAMEPVKINYRGELKKGQERIGAKFPCASLVKVENKDNKIYKRYGNNQNNGSPQHEFILVDAKGKVEKSCALMWDYEKVTSMLAYPIDDNIITVKGGKFTTIANAVDGAAYFQRGIRVKRSNVVIDGIVHTVVDEGEIGSPYSGIVTVAECCMVTISNCVFCGHRIYQKQGKLGTPVPRGTYDISINNCVKIALKNCTQSTSIDDTKKWGIMGTNFTKDVLIENCQLSRYDAHQGVENLVIRNSVFGHMGVRMVGCGTITLENCVLRYQSLLSLRSDYGSFWDGDIIVRNCVLKPVKKVKTLTLLSGENKGKHDFGYPCRIPHSMVFENVVIDDSVMMSDSKYKGPYIFSSFNRDAHDTTLVPFGTDCTVTLKNVVTKSGLELQLSPNPDLFKNVVIIRK